MLEWIAGGLGLLALAQAESWLRMHWDRCKARDAELEKQARATRIAEKRRWIAEERQASYMRADFIARDRENRLQSEREDQLAAMQGDQKAYSYPRAADTLGLSGAGFGLGYRARYGYREDTGTTPFCGFRG